MLLQEFSTVPNSVENGIELKHVILLLLFGSFLAPFLAPFWLLFGSFLTPCLWSLISEHLLGPHCCIKTCI